MMVDLENDEWQQVIGILSQAPWRVANPLLMKIGEQLRVQQPANNRSAPMAADGKEINHG
jgi:hypothetical protein